MITILGPEARKFCDGLTRRSFIRIGALGLGGASLPQLLEAAAGPGKSGGKSVIMIYLPGGPPHQDTFDLKPEAPAEIRGSFQPIETNVPGVRICELLPQLARITDKLAIIRSLVGAKDRHESFQCYTGRLAGRPGDIEPAGGWPTLGSVVSATLGGRRGMPSYVDAAPRMGYGPYNNTGLHDASAVSSWPGFLGAAHTPFRLEGDGREDLVLNGISNDRLTKRRTLLAHFDRFRRAVDEDASRDGFDAFREQAFGILTSSRLAEALDLEREPANVRERYGVGGPTTASFGGAPKSPQHLLLARRLVEAGVRCVTVAFGAWDWHANRGGPLVQLAKEDLPMFDHAIATLIDDLDQRGLLDDVSVVVWGEFGRTPRINAKGGRDHWPRVATALLAGGGMRCGQVIGATDAHAGEATKRPVHFQEVFATLYHNLGIDVRTTTVRDLNGRPHYLVDAGRRPIEELL